MNEEQKLDPIEVFAGNSWDTGMVKSLLADNEIEAYLIGENLASVIPWISTPAGVESISVVVAAEDYDKALPIVEAFKKTQV
jgi:hypothetical protein